MNITTKYIVWAYPNKSASCSYFQKVSSYNVVVRLICNYIRCTGYSTTWGWGRGPISQLSSSIIKSNSTPEHKTKQNINQFELKFKNT